MLSVLALAASGLGIGAVTKSHERIAVPGIAYRRIAGTGSQSETTIIVRSNDTNPLMQAFLSVVRGLKFDSASRG
jgi:DNA-binding transcriptional LysR family regulator